MYGTYKLSKNSPVFCTPCIITLINHYFIKLKYVLLQNCKDVFTAANVAYMPNFGTKRLNRDLSNPLFGLTVTHYKTLSCGDQTADARNVLTYK